MLAGCGTNAVGACEKATDASTACIDAYCTFLGDACIPAAEPDETLSCEAVYGEVKGDAAKAQIEIFECQEAAGTAAACDTQEGFDAYLVALGECGAAAA